MFYSHQLLSKKGPLGQIWIAATIQGKMNKKKVERIDITEICTHIIEPQVPLALRLSGILMGGVVIVYSRKVNILLDDANDFLTKLKSAIAAKPADNINLPKNRQSAKYDAITIQRVDLAAFGDIERLLLHPHGTQTQEPLGEDFFVMPRVEAEKDTSRKREKHQARSENITLNERLPEDADGMLNRDEADDILPPPDPMEMDFLAMPGTDFADLPDMPDMPDIPLPDDIAFPAGGLDTIMEETKQEAEEEARSTPPDLKTPPKPKRARRGRKRQVFIDETTEVPAPEFDRWLKDATQLVGRGKKRCVRTELATINKLFRLPGTMLRRNVHGEPISDWSPELLTIFEERIDARDAVKLEKKKRSTGAGVLQEEGEELEEEAQNAQARAEEETFFEGGDFVDFPAPDMQDINFPLPDQEEFGSVEKLRAALKTPASNPEDAFGDFTPIRPGLGPVEGSARSKLSKQSGASSQSGRLVMDDEIDAPTTGKSRRAQRLSEVFSQTGISPALNGPFGGDMLPDIDDESPGQQRLQEALSMQASLLEETAPVTQARYVHDAIDRVTSNVMNYMREQFDAEQETQEEPHLSMDDMTRGLDRMQAARFFYQVCVMTSNRFLKVEQAEPYGDILMFRSRLL